MNFVYYLVFGIVLPLLIDEHVERHSVKVRLAGRLRPALGQQLRGMEGLWLPNPSSIFNLSIRGFPRMEVSLNAWLIMEHPIQMGGLGVLLF